MRYAILVDKPRNDKKSQTLLRNALEVYTDHYGIPLEWEIIPATKAKTKGNVPTIKEILAERDELLVELEGYAPDIILAMGPAAANAMAGKVVKQKQEFGRNRMCDEIGIPWIPSVVPYYVLRNPDLYRDLAFTIEKPLVNGPMPLEPMVSEWYIPETRRELESCLDDLSDASVIGVDVETQGLDPWLRDKRMYALGIGAWDGLGGISIHILPHLFDDEAAMDAVWETVWQKDRRAVGHNFKFDMQWLQRIIDWPPDGALIGDTLLLAHLLDERPVRPQTRARGSGLKDLVAMRYDHQYEFDGDFATVDPYDEKLNDYLALDTAYTARLWHDLWKVAELEGDVRNAHDKLLIPVAKTIAKAELRGAPIDRAWIEATIREHERRIDRRKRALESSPYCGTDVDNVLSAAQIASLVYERWRWEPEKTSWGDEEDRSTDREHLETLASRYIESDDEDEVGKAKWISMLIRLRRDVRTMKAFEGLLERSGTDDRVHASFLLHGAATGRISSQKPNLQNVPALDRQGAEKRRPMRRAFAPPKGRVWIEADYSQLELRVAAGLSQDRAFMQVFQDEHDVHLEVASTVFDLPPEQITKDQRFMAKAIGFGILYGRSAKAISEGKEMDYAETVLGMPRWTEEQAQGFTDRFLDGYPRLKEWIAEMHELSRTKRFVETPYGRRRRFPAVPDSRGALNRQYRQAVNTPIQSVASDICLEAMARLDDLLELHSIDAAVLFPVHDSICIEANEAQIHHVETWARAAMEQDFEGVPLVIDFEYGTSWAKTA